jgi:L-ascorbate metabolism protein UlaG (beta-lactamase superfamily)
MLKLSSVPDTTMARLVDRQPLVDRQEDEIVFRYPLIWDKLINDWKSPGPEDRAWLMYSANYLFRTHGVCWAIDTLELKSRLPQAPAMDVAQDLKDLAFVLLTHSHKDHLDLELLRQLRHLPILWVVPEAMISFLQEEISLTSNQVLVSKHLQPIELNGICITPFKGLHWEVAPSYPDGKRGVPATGYLVEVGAKRWLFPGDTRTFDPAEMTDFGGVDVLFAHLWLGRGAALLSRPLLLERFCSFFLALKPRRIILTHLEEWGRHVADFWGLEHAGLVISALKKQAPSLSIEIARMGDEILLA